MSLRVSGEQNFAVWLRKHDVSSVQVVDERSVVRLLSAQFTQANYRSYRTAMVARRSYLFTAHRYTHCVEEG